MLRPSEEGHPHTGAAMLHTPRIQGYFKNMPIDSAVLIFRGCVRVLSTGRSDTREEVRIHAERRRFFRSPNIVGIPIKHRHLNQHDDDVRRPRRGNTGTLRSRPRLPDAIYSSTGFHGLTILESMRLATISGMLPASGSPSVASFA